MCRSRVISAFLGGIFLVTAAASGDVFIDFETLPDGSPAASGNPVADSYVQWGVSFSEIGLGPAEPQFWNGYHADGLFASTRTNGGYPPGFNIKAEFDLLVFRISVDVMTAANHTVTMLAKDAYGTVIGTAVSEPAPSTFWAGRLSITTDTPIATVEWWPSAQTAAVGIDNLEYGRGLGPSVLLYDVDFGTPPHTVGQPPATGTGPPPRETPTSIVFGDPTVVAALGVLSDQPCEFGNGTTGYDQLRFGVHPSDAHGFAEAYDRYHVELDVLVEQLDGTVPSNCFTVILDTPTVRNLNFEPDGDIRLWPADGSGLIGTYDFGVPVFVEMDVDIPGDELAVRLDGTEAYSGSYNADKLHSIRFNLDGEHAGDAVAVDDFRVYGADQACVGDVDGDNDTDLSDLAALLAAYCTHPGDPRWNPNADFDGDGHVGLSDLAYLLADYGCGG